jgi:hypothetical protein
LHPNSTVEYNGGNNQIITGVNQGLALTSDHRYGILDIDFQGTPDAEWVYPMNDSVYVRTDLRLTTGEFNLDTDHNAASGGRILRIENGATVSRTGGYLRSETIDGSASMEWNITTTGSFIIPFGYNSGIYIPFTYQPTAGSSGDVVFATYHSNADNTPYPPTVTHTRDLSGADNSPNTVDRFWMLQVPGAVTANLQYSFAAAEAVGVVSPRSQRWEPISEGWELPQGIQSNPTATTTSAAGLTGLGTWWTLSSSGTPLPVQLISFMAFAEYKRVKLNWVTASELNNFYFTIQRSGTGEHFIDLFNVGGAGTTSSLTSYTAIDPNPLHGNSYYRLKQVDYNGKYSFSPVRKVMILTRTPVSIYPNPAREGLVTVSTGNVDDKINRIDIYDMTGRILESKNYSDEGYGDASVAIEIDNSFPNGTYMLVVSSDTGLHRERIVKQ